MVKLKPITKSLILTISAILINFIAYLSFRGIIFKEFNALQSLAFMGWASVLDFIVIFIVSFLIFKFFDGR
jgi:hypothetical protein